MISRFIRPTSKEHTSTASSIANSTCEFLRATPPHLRLKKTLYGLKQFGREWGKVLGDALNEQGFERCENEWGIYVQTDKSGVQALLLAYVDDLVIAACLTMDIKRILDGLAAKWKISKLDLAHSWYQSHSRSIPEKALDLPNRIHRKSGYLATLYGSPINWCSKRQATTAASTMEAEYIAASEPTKDIIWLRNLLGELGLIQDRLQLCTSITKRHFDLQATLPLIPAPNTLISIIISSANASRCEISIFPTSRRPSSERTCLPSLCEVHSTP